MESVYNPKDYNATAPINTSIHFEEYSSQINRGHSNEGETDVNMKTFKLMGVSLDPTQRSQLLEKCSIDNLTIDEEPELLEVDYYFQQCHSYKPTQIPEKANSLSTIQVLKKRLRKNVNVDGEDVKPDGEDIKPDGEDVKPDKSSSADRNFYLKYSSEMKLERTITTGSVDIKESEDILYFVRVYYPFRYIPAVRQYHLPRFSHEVLLTGTNTLADLRDKILCSADVATAIDVSQNPTDSNGDEELYIAKERYPSGFIFIDGTFYNDHRMETHIDYSDVIIEWTKNRRNIGPFETAVMEETTLKDLTVRLGYPQVYQHQGNCEHLLVFSDIRLAHQEDSLNSQDYPLFSSIAFRCSKYCMMCGEIVARWIVTKCSRLPSDPTYLCESCFYSYLYINNKKVCDFKAYRFYDKSAVI